MRSNKASKSAVIIYLFLPLTLPPPTIRGPPLCKEREGGKERQDSEGGGKKEKKEKGPQKVMRISLPFQTITHFDLLLG